MLSETNLRSQFTGWLKVQRGTHASSDAYPRHVQTKQHGPSLPGREESGTDRVTTPGNVYTSQLICEHSEESRYEIRNISALGSPPAEWVRATSWVTDSIIPRDITLHCTGWERIPPARLTYTALSLRDPSTSYWLCDESVFLPKQASLLPLHCYCTSSRPFPSSWRRRAHYWANYRSCLNTISLWLVIFS